MTIDQQNNEHHLYDSQDSDPQSSNQSHIDDNDEDVTENSSESQDIFKEDNHVSQSESSNSVDHEITVNNVRLNYKYSGVVNDVTRSQEASSSDDREARWWIPSILKNQLFQYKIIYLCADVVTKDNFLFYPLIFFYYLSELIMLDKFYANEWLRITYVFCNFHRINNDKSKFTFAVLIVSRIRTFTLYSFSIFCVEYKWKSIIYFNSIQGYYSLIIKI